MAIIVTGVSGELGGLVARRLVRDVAPEDLIFVTRNPAALDEELRGQADVRYGDFEHPETLRSAFADGSDMLLISTTQVGDRRRRQHRNAIRQAAAAGVRRIAYTSSVGIHPRNPCFVIPDHVYTEDLLRQSGLEFTILRIGAYADRAAKFGAPAAIAAGRWISMHGDGKFAPVAKEDCAAVAAAVLKDASHSRAIYEVTGPELVCLRDIVALASELSGQAIEYIAHDPAVGSGGLRDNQVAQVGNSIGPHSFGELESYEIAVRNGFYHICSGHVQFVTGSPARSLREVFEAYGLGVCAAAREGVRNGN